MGKETLLKLTGGILLGLFLFATSPLLPTTTAGIIVALACLLLLKKEERLEKVTAYALISFFFPASFILFKQLGVLVADVLYATAVVLLLSSLLKSKPCD